ncbi:T-complex protein 11 X-linked protein 2 [Manis javanica]|nr:T-complex protein 11 X-linked protein 2 [Manis javanica]
MIHLLYECNVLFSSFEFVDKLKCITKALTEEFNCSSGTGNTSGVYVIVLAPGHGNRDPEERAQHVAGMPSPVDGRAVFLTTSRTQDCSVQACKQVTQVTDILESGPAEPRLGA